MPSRSTIYLGILLSSCTWWSIGPSLQSNASCFTGEVSVAVFGVATAPCTASFLVIGTREQQWLDFVWSLAQDLDHVDLSMVGIITPLSFSTRTRYTSPSDMDLRLFWYSLLEKETLTVLYHQFL
jgi:hypothetical protein